MTHEELAARIERAEGPDRALDREIATAMGWVCEAERDSRGHLDEWWLDASGKSYAHLPNWTASIDAAMQLVPEGWQIIKIEWFANDTWHVVMRDWHIQSDIYPAKVSNGHAETPALALSAAAIRARSAS